MTTDQKLRVLQALHREIAATGHARTLLARWYQRRARHLLGFEYPDARDQELRDRGLELQWRARVRRRELRRDYRVIDHLEPPALLRRQAD